MNANRFKAIVEYRRKELALKPTKSKKVPRPPYPYATERMYRKDVLNVTETLKALTDKILIPKLPELEKRSRESLGLTHLADDWNDDLEELINSIGIEFRRTWTENELRLLATRRGLEVNQFVSKYLERTAERVLGVDIVASNPWLAGIMQSFAKNNADLITSIEQRYLGEIKTASYTAFRTGTRWEDLRDQIYERYDVSESRAELIARDQIGKINGQLNEVQQSSLGVTEYVWRTSLDERVRESHRALEGRTFTWDNTNPPPEDIGHPGQDYQCRCTAEPVLDALLK